MSDVEAQPPAVYVGRESLQVTIRDDVRVDVWEEGITFSFRLSWPPDVPPRMNWSVFTLVGVGPAEPDRVALRDALVAHAEGEQPGPYELTEPRFLRCDFLHEPPS